MANTAFKQLTELLGWVDLVIEVLDARLPDDSRHPKAKEIFGHKPRLIVLSKSDLADPKALSRYVEKHKEQGLITLSIKGMRDKEKLMEAVLNATAEKRKSIAAKGLLERPMRIGVVGMPNTGKSSLINWLIGRRKTNVGNRPGVTRGKQWVRVHPKLELLDTPGILPQSGLKPDAALRLAVFNLIPGTNYEIEEAANLALVILREHYPSAIRKLVPNVEDLESINLEAIARKHNFIQTKAAPDTGRAAGYVLNELRSGNLGRISGP